MIWVINYYPACLMSTVCVLGNETVQMSYMERFAQFGLIVILWGQLHLSLDPDELESCNLCAV